MAEFQAKKREIAHKLRIGELLKGTPIVEEVPMQSPEGEGETFSQQPKERFRFLELGDRKIVRVNIIGNIVDKYSSEGDKKYASITIDDATGQIRLKVFGEDVAKYQDLSHGDTILVIGLLRTYAGDVYITPEIIKRADPKYLLIRKLELDNKSAESIQKAAAQPEKPQGLREQILTLIKAEESGASTSDIILKLTDADPGVINEEIIKLLEDGIIYEPRPGKVRYLG